MTYSSEQYNMLVLGFVICFSQVVLLASQSGGTATGQRAMCIPKLQEALHVHVVVFVVYIVVLRPANLGAQR